MQFKKLSIRTLNQHSKHSLNKVFLHTYISYQLSADVKVGFFFVTAEQSAEWFEGVKQNQVHICNFNPSE